MNVRCEWARDQIEIDYHDKEWGIPLHNDRMLFEFLVLEGMQAGLSWRIILNKRQEFRKAFDKFEVELVANYDSMKIKELCSNSLIIRNKKKIEATVSNANAFIRIQKEFGSFDKYIWLFTKFKTVVNKWKTIKEIPPKTEISDSMSKDLKQRGFGFVGSTICYSFMQAAGMVNDHVVECFRYKEVQRIDK